MTDAPKDKVQHGHITGSGNVVVQLSGNFNQVSVLSSPHLILTTHQARRPTASSELELLDPFRRTIALTGRQRDLDDLSSWVHSDRQISVRTIVGRAGAGKTRIALELLDYVKQYELQKWVGGFVTGREMARFAMQTNLAQWGWQSPTLVVVDYAASVVRQLDIWLQDLIENERPTSPSLRILLLEREANADRGWLASLRDASWSGSPVNNFFDSIEPIRLSTVDEPDARRHILEEAVFAAASLMQKTVPPVASLKDPLLARSLESPVFADPLYLMMAGILAVGSGSPIIQMLGFSRTDLSFGLADRELNRLERFDGGDKNLLVLLKHLAACATATDGLSHEDARAVADEEAKSLQRVYAHGPAALAEIAGQALIRADGGIAGIVPDIIGEAVILRALGDAGGTDAILRMNARYGMRVVATVIRCAQDFTAAGFQQPLAWLNAIARTSDSDDYSTLVAIHEHLSR